jgi:hypothetical protein
MKILGIIAFIEIILLVIASTISGLNINIFLSSGSTTIMAEILGGLLLIYPITNLVMHSKIKLKNWHSFGILMTMLMSTLAVFILAAFFKDAKYIKTEYIGYIIQLGFSILVILVLRNKHGTLPDNAKP